MDEYSITLRTLGQNLVRAGIPKTDILKKYIRPLEEGKMLHISYEPNTAAGHHTEHRTQENMFMFGKYNLHFVLFKDAASDQVMAVGLKEHGSLDINTLGDNGAYRNAQVIAHGMQIRYRPGDSESIFSGVFLRAHDAIARFTLHRTYGDILTVQKELARDFLQRPDTDMNAKHFAAAEAVLEDKKWALQGYFNEESYTRVQRHLESKQQTKAQATPKPEPQDEKQQQPAGNWLSKLGELYKLIQPGRL